MTLISGLFCYKGELEIKSENRKKGKWGEDRACEYLKQLGYSIIERNFSSKAGEIDIIAEYEGTLHFIEVKARRNNSFGHPLEAVTPVKLRHIRDAASLYLMKNRLMGSCPISIDAVAITGDEISLIKGIG